MTRSVDLEHGNVDPVTSKDGQAVELDRLRHDIKTALLDTGPRRDRPDPHHGRRRRRSATKDLAKEYPAIIIVNRGAFSLRFYKDLKLSKTYRIAVGQVGLETPAGPLPRPEQGREPGLARAELRVGRRPRRAR